MLQKTPTSPPNGRRKIGLALNICVDELVVDKAVRAF